MIYRVEVKVQPEISARYKAWISSHIEEVITNPGFTEAILMIDATETHFSVDYICQSEELLDDYLKNRAPALREKAFKEFGDKFLATREIYTQMKSFQT
jgi:hypothetical protein